jgi:glycosyltransferase involved in cell wall biosynthesis
MNVIIFGDSFSFPEGDASTNRVHTYAKGFYENGINVHLICFRNEYDTISEGELNGIFFYNPFGQRKRSKYLFIRRWKKLSKYFKTIILLRRIDKKDKIDAFIVYTMSLHIHLFAWFLSRISNAKLLKESGEHPLQYYQRGPLKRLQGLIKLNIESHLCDGILCISFFLLDFYKNHGITQNKLFHVPSTVDTERFKFSYDSPLAFQYILYCGGLNRSKDGVDILIESFVKIAEKHPEIYLVLVGKGDTIEDELDIKDLVVNCNTNNRVIFLGYLSRNEIPAYLINAKILALARPRSMVADAGFPSKLTEYLAIGIPVVVTEVGDIPVYLKNNENAFLSIPDSVDAFAEKLDFVLSNYKFAKEVAKKGKELTSSTFNYNYQSRRIIEFIISI